MGTQKNRLDETVLLGTQNTFKLMDKKRNAILLKLFLLNWPYDGVVKLCQLVLEHFILSHPDTNIDFHRASKAKIICVKLGLFSYPSV